MAQKKTDRITVETDLTFTAAILDISGRSERIGNILSRSIR